MELAMPHSLQPFDRKENMTSLYLFIAASAVLIATPGPDVIYVLTRGMSGGRIAGIMSAIGVTSGILVHTVAASLGLTVLLQTSTYAFWTMKIIGGGYLIYLGIQMIRKRRDLVLKRTEADVRTRQCIWQGFLSNVFNPKVALFFVAFLPQFVNPGMENQSVHMIFLGLLFALMTLIFLVILGVFAGAVSSWLYRRKEVGERIGGASGAVLMILGIRLLLPVSK
jgi:threonine/homoserine/homoserine lactone efflux protein